LIRAAGFSDTQYSHRIPSKFTPSKCYSHDPSRRASIAYHRTSSADTVRILRVQITHLDSMHPGLWDQGIVEVHKQRRSHSPVRYPPARSLLTVKPGVEDIVQAVLEDILCNMKSRATINVSGKSRDQVKEAEETPDGTRGMILNRLFHMGVHSVKECYWLTVRTACTNHSPKEYS